MAGRGRRRTASAGPDADEDAEGEDDVEDEAMEDTGDQEDEQVYCFCQKLSYGEMVGCDNEDCRYQWVRSFLLFYVFGRGEMLTRLCSSTLAASTSSRRCQTGGTALSVRRSLQLLAERRGQIGAKAGRSSEGARRVFGSQLSTTSGLHDEISYTNVQYYGGIDIHKETT